MNESEQAMKRLTELNADSFSSDRSVTSEAATVPATDARCPDCSDKDEDCAEVMDKVKCWVYAPERGMCPYLRSAPISDND
jgi:hypothetical protein